MRTVRITSFLIALGALCVPCDPSSARNQEALFDLIRTDHELLEKSLHNERFALSSVAPAAVNAQSIDVKHYRLQIQLVPNQSGTAGVIKGVVTISGETTGTVSDINIDAQQNLQIDSVRLDGVPNGFGRSKKHVAVNYPAPVPAGRQFTIVIQYQGPGSGGGIGGGLLFTRHGPDSTPVVASHSEPFGAPLWWPCVDNPADKATAEIEVTVPEGNLAASNGVLDRVQVNPDHTITYLWREDSPLSTYLVSVASTNYQTLEDTYVALDGVTRMPLIFYVYPEHLESARAKFPVTRTALEIYAGLFGEYPFVGEKYGMAEFPFGGAMEHQTITSLSAGIVASASSHHCSRACASLVGQSGYDAELG
jgi:aminopeptidase N